MKFPDLDLEIYDRQGNRITFDRYVELLGDSKTWADYRRVAFDQYGDFDVSTVWLGIDHNWFGEGDPIIFETMIFIRSPNDEHTSVYCRRYRTEASALKGHKKALESLKTPHIIEATLEEITQEEAEE